MELARNLAMLSVILFLIWISIKYIARDIVIGFFSKALLEDFNITSSDNIFRFISEKMKSSSGKNYIRNKRIDIVSYLECENKKRKVSFETVLTIIITSLTTISIASYNISVNTGVQGGDVILKMLSGDFSIIVFLLGSICFPNLIVKEIVEIKKEYYIKVRNVIDELYRDNGNMYKQMVIR